MTTSRVPLVSTEGYAVGNLSRNVGQPCRYLRSACSSGHGAQKKLRESRPPRVEDHTMRYPLIAGLACAVLLASVTAISAQTPAVPGSVPGDAAATPETAAPKQKPKRKGPPSSVTVINATAHTATGLVITAGEKT